MSSHREAPGISKDPVADSTDVYAFVSPDKPDTVTLIANYVPLQGPAGGPNFYEFGDDVLYQIKIDNDRDGHSDVTYLFRFTTTVADPNTFLYNTGPIKSLSSSSWNRRQSYSIVRDEHGHHETLGSNLACPPCNIGPLSTPDYPALANEAVHSLRGGRKVFAGQRAEGFYVDLGSILRPRGPAPVRQRAQPLRPVEVPDERTRGERDEEPQRALHRAPGADHRPYRGRQEAQRDQRSAGDDRRMDHRQPAACPGVRHGPQPVREQRPLHPGLPAWQPAGQ